MASMTEVVHEGSIAIVTLRRPPANAMNLAFTKEMAAVFQRLGQDGSVRSLVLTGEGKSFCAVVDLKALPDFDEAYQRRMVGALNRAFHAVYSCPVPVVARYQRPRHCGRAGAGNVLRLARCGEYPIPRRSDRGPCRRALSRGCDGSGSNGVGALKSPGN